jgi:hypothetical protein
MARVVQSGGSREPYWRLVVTRWKRSGLTVRTFCRTEGLNQGVRPVNPVPHAGRAAAPR